MSRRFIQVFMASLGLVVVKPYALAQSPSKQLPVPGKTPPVPGKSLPVPGKTPPVPGKSLPVPGESLPRPFESGPGGSQKPIKTILPAVPPQLPEVKPLPEDLK